MEGQARAVYVHPNKGFEQTALHDLAIRIEYENVDGTLHIDHYYSEFGEPFYHGTHKLDEKDVTGNGSITFETTHKYIGVHVLIFRPDYDPSRVIEIWLYTIHYELRPEKGPVIYSLASGFIGTFLASAGIMHASIIRKNREV